MRYLFFDLIADECGGALVEYGIIAGLLAAPCILALIAIADTAGTVLSNTGTGLTSIAQTNP